MARPLIEAAAMERSGQITFEISPSSSSEMGRVAPEGGLVVRAVSIDETVEAQRLKRVDFIKMDIEGAERYALSGARRTLARFGPQLAICLYHRPDDRQVLPELVLGIRPSYRVQENAAGSHAYFSDVKSPPRR